MAGGLMPFRSMDERKAQFMEKWLREPPEKLYWELQALERQMKALYAEVLRLRTLLGDDAA